MRSSLEIFKQVMRLKHLLKRKDDEQEVNSLLTKLQKSNLRLPSFPLISEQLKQKHFKITFFDICKPQKWLRR